MADPMPSREDRPERLLQRLRWSAPALKPALRRIADHVLANPAAVKASSIEQVARACAVSGSTVTRFVRTLGVPSFPAFKIRIAEELSTAAERAAGERDRRLVYEDVAAGDDTATIRGKIAGRYVETVRDTLAGLPLGEIERAVEAIRACDVIAFFAAGSSIIAVENALMRFLRVGKQCQFFREASMAQFSTATLNARTLAVAISNSGRTIATVRALQEARAHGATTLAITSFPDAPLAGHADITLLTPTVAAPAGPADYHESMVSKIAQLQVVDTLYACYAARTSDTSIAALARSGVYTTDSRY